MLGLSVDSTIAFSIGISRIASLEAETTGLTYGSLFISINGYSVFECDRTRPTNYLPV